MSDYSVDQQSNLFRLPNELLCFIYDELVEICDEKVTPDGDLTYRSCNDIRSLRAVSNRLRLVGQRYFAKVITNTSFMLIADDIITLREMGKDLTLTPYIHTLRFNPTLPYYGAFEEAEKDGIEIRKEFKDRDFEYLAECQLWEDIRHWGLDHHGYASEWSESIAFLVGILYPFENLKHVDLGSWRDYKTHQRLYLDDTISSWFGDGCSKELQSRVFFLNIFQAALDVVAPHLYFLRVGEMTNIYPAPHFPIPRVNLSLANVRHLEIGFVDQGDEDEKHVFSDPRLFNYVSTMRGLETLLLVGALYPSELQKGLRGFFKNPFPKLRNVKLCLSYITHKFAVEDWFLHLLPPLKAHAKSLRLLILEMEYKSQDWVNILPSITKELSLDELRICFPVSLLEAGLKDKSPNHAKKMTQAPAAKRVDFYYGGKENKNVECRPSVKKWVPIITEGEINDCLPYKPAPK
ncbi:uncharacterized protein K452DRAFT_311958 [Aplosporella prunicola CBS 121167]|uniref:Uncharacterized protein n=1 Tax=Aplosporella prunicola CBS 121167 TaxID=1176127 RepID=A0A6A6B1A7_9PEZI|nr:uncharacterized protein K452DRAFT_311958 [Aplosporella prunicola CBS 121167]KAF2137820.1 hypothetical protein K452DRAFT_311958 [Aplosporella prunicola CBS 121167]